MLWFASVSSVSLTRVGIRSDCDSSSKQIDS
jgi:hypothetical protein